MHSILVNRFHVGGAERSDLVVENSAAETGIMDTEHMDDITLLEVITEIHCRWNSGRGGIRGGIGGAEELAEKGHLTED